MPTSTPLPTRLPTRARGGVTTIASSMERLPWRRVQRTRAVFDPQPRRGSRLVTALGRLGSVFRPVAVPAPLGAGGTGFCLRHQRRTVHPIGCVTQPTEWE